MVALAVKLLAAKRQGEIRCQSTTCVCNVADDRDRRRATPVTRERVVKGSSVNREPPQFSANVVTKESADLKAAREFQASLGSSSKQSKTCAKGATSSIHGSQSSQSLLEERLAKPMARPPRQGYMVLNERHHSSLTFGSPVPQVELASPETFMAIARIRANIPRTAEQPSQQPNEATVQSSASTVVRPVEASGPNVKAPLPTATQQITVGTMAKQPIRQPIRTTVKSSATTVVRPVEASAPKIKISLPTATEQTRSGKVAIISPNKVEISLPPKKNQTAGRLSPVANATLTDSSEQPVPNISRSQTPQQPSRPILDPLGHIRALEASGLLSKELTEMLNNAVRTPFHAQATTKPITEERPKEKTAKDADVDEPSRRAVYTQTELKALRPKTESGSPPKLPFTASQINDATREAEKPTNPLVAPNVPLQPTGPAENPRGIAQRLADQRKALIGEHIHRTRFQPPLQSLIEGFKKLSLHDCTNTESATGNSDATSMKLLKATENPFGSVKTPELPAHLREEAPLIDHGAAARAQYGLVKPLGAPKPKGSGPELPLHLRNIVPAADHGAAVRRQYGIPDFTTPDLKIQSNTMAVPEVVETSPQRRSQAGPNTSSTARSSAPTKARPSLPAFLRDQRVEDTGAAARAQYGGEVVAPLANKRAPSLTVSKEGNLARSRPQLPAHLRGQTTGDPGAAVRAQYGNVLAPVTNSLFSSSSTPREAPSSPTKPRSGSKVNSSGFIGLAQAARNVTKEDDDPIKIASSKGF